MTKRHPPHDTRGRKSLAAGPQKHRQKRPAPKARPMQVQKRYNDKEDYITDADFDEEVGADTLHALHIPIQSSVSQISLRAESKSQRVMERLHQEIDLEDMKTAQGMLDLFGPDVSAGEGTLAISPTLEMEISLAAEQALRNDMAHSNDHERSTVPFADTLSMAAKSILADPDLGASLRETGLILKKYKSGTLPKILLGIPSSSAWEPVLELTNPSEWSPHATLAITRLFISKLSEDQAYLFNKNILLNRVRVELRSSQKLPIHLFDALGKATFKPRAFYKGIIFPLAQTDACSVLIKAASSVLKRASIPGQISSPALVHLTNMPHNGAVAAFIAVILDKNYTFPVSTLNHVITFYEQVARDNVSSQLPLVYHVGLMTLVRKYGVALQGEQQLRLVEIVRLAPHTGGISDEILRLLRENVGSFGGPFTFRSDELAI
ncbi:Bystin [Giardia muris]|uniref:Bystin n=1 Tax=Giardia muris TaxID=5742 RepID=A0A4Z1ST88_GIAMU|nr:Bystin [Giardia muris]|eukprot:TNJ28215.1 Bystin [Giardia muris]